jgi:signal transduction histidine kinase/DNA-binding response OmpR family regulator
MDPLRLMVELLFGLVFVFVARRYLRSRDAVSRDLVLAFAGLGLTVVVDIWRRATGSTPPAAGIVVGVLLLLQPLFVLHLVSLIRDVPRWLLLGATGLLVGSATVAILVRSVPTFALIAVGAFIAIEALAAGLLLLEARGRHGPGAVRLMLAAASTALFAATLVSAGIGSIQNEFASSAALVSIVLALLAAVGYLVAFAPPAVIGRAWQSSGTVGYVRRLIEMAGEPADVLWAELAILATAVRGGSAFVVVPSDDGTGRVAASAGLTPSTIATDNGDGLSAAQLERLRAVAASGAEVPIDDQIGLIVGGARPAGGISVLRLASTPLSPLLVLVFRHRSLFEAADRELLVALGSQTAIVVERRLIVAEQEELAARLRSTVEALRAASQAKSDFLASMSHELRTPLSAILGFSDLMQSEPAVDGNVTVPLEWVHHMHRGGEHLVSLINDVLDLAKVEAGRLELHAELIDLGTLATEVTNGVRPIAERKRVRLSMVAPTMALRADRGRVRQILYNLLSNAIKYTPEDGTVALRISGSGSEVEIEVRDTGVGIAPDDLGVVFDEFRQVGDHEVQQQGTGLGLALTKRLVDLHAGSIRVESVVGQGSTFTVSLPSGLDATTFQPIVTEPEDLARRRPAAGGMPIVIIEDDPSAVRLLREYLEPAGYAVHAAATGPLGLELLRRHRPAAVILDVLLPGLDGWEILRQIKADPELSNVPVIIVTVVDEREIGLALGAADYIVKPIRRDALLHSLDQHVPRTHGGAKPRVLAVDDDPAALDLVRAALEPEGFDVRTTTSSIEALRLVVDGTFDIVVSDVVMPELNGLELAERIHTNPRTASLPILLVTAHDLTAAEKAQLNGQIIGIASKGMAARSGLLRWLEPYLPDQVGGVLPRPGPVASK